MVNSAAVKQQFQNASCWHFWKCHAVNVLCRRLSPTLKLPNCFSAGSALDQNEKWDRCPQQQIFAIHAHAPKMAIVRAFATLPQSLTCSRSMFPALLPDGWRAMPFEPFHAGVEACWLRRGDSGEASAALLRYAPGASVPRHRHAGLESILVLEGPRATREAPTRPAASCSTRPAASIPSGASAAASC